VTPPAAGRRTGRGFLSRAYANRRYARLSSGLILGLPYVAAAAWLCSRAHLLDSWIDRVGLGAIVLIMLAGYALFPLVRELYFRMTSGLRDGLAGLTVSGLLVPVVYLIRMTVYVFLLVLAIPLGLIALLYLGLSA